MNMPSYFVDTTLAPAENRLSPRGRLIVT